jgi:nanoRNase/pAp phosphatase (c-di-AMP/oligoRNAs hydrolase)
MNDRLNELREILSGKGRVLILPHNDPDPDGIAAALGMRYLLSEFLSIEAQIVFHGIIGRAENKALVGYLHRPLRKLSSIDFQLGYPIALIDTQPGAGNNKLPGGIRPWIVNDHHAWREESANARFVDIRPDVGASATIITGYLRAAGLDLPASLATALFYGIKTDTMSLGRSASPLDASAYFYLQPQIDVNALINIERAQVPKNYFSSLVKSLHAARTYDDDLLIVDLGVVSYPDLGAEMADLFLRLQGIKWVMCIGEYRHELILSVRSRSRRAGAGNLARAIVGSLGSAGGHGTMAGGQISLVGRKRDEICHQLIASALHYLKKDADLISSSIIE